MNTTHIALLAVGLLALGARAQELGYELQDTVVEPGELVTLTLVLDGQVSLMRGFTLALEYDNSLLDLYSINQGSLLLPHSPSFLYWNNEIVNGHSVVQVDYAILGDDEGVAGPGELLRVVFEGIGCGIQTLAVVDAQFRDLDNQPIAMGLGSGIEQQVCQVPPLAIRHLPGGGKELDWSRVLNAQYFTVYRSTEMAGPWLPVHTTSDTLWVDNSVSAWPQALYRLSVEHP